jgi:hypothetical protein
VIWPASSTMTTSKGGRVASSGWCAERQGQPTMGVAAASCCSSAVLWCGYLGVQCACVQHVRACVRVWCCWLVCAGQRWHAALGPALQLPCPPPCGCGCPLCARTPGAAGHVGVHARVAARGAAQAQEAVAAAASELEQDVVHRAVGVGRHEHRGARSRERLDRVHDGARLARACLKGSRRRACAGVCERAHARASVCAKQAVCTRMRARSLRQDRSAQTERPRPRTRARTLTHTYTHTHNTHTHTPTPPHTHTPTPPHTHTPTHPHTNTHTHAAHAPGMPSTRQ